MSRAREMLPHYEIEPFSNAALELCLVQVRYPALPRFAEAGYLSNIQEALAEEYPLFGPEQSMNIVLTPQGVSQTAGGQNIRFNDIERRWSVILSSDFVSIETRHYSNIREFATRFSEVLRLVAVHLRPRLQLRFGLRYVNEFRHKQGDRYNKWQQLLNPDLLGIAGRNVLGGTVEQTVGEVRTSRPDGTFLLRHGFLDGTTVAPLSPKPPQSGPFYLLDLDYYLDTPQPFDPRPTERMHAYNDYIYRVFRWSIGDGELYRQLRG